MSTVARKPERKLKLKATSHRLERLALANKPDLGNELRHLRKQVAKAEPVTLMPDLPVRDAFKAIAQSCLRQIVGNTDAVRARNPDAIHQMRVGMRRLRAAISIFSEIVDDNKVHQIKQRLKHYAGALGPARDLDIMIAEVLRPLGRLDPGANALVRSFARRRTRAYRAAIQAITSDAFEKFTIECAAWIEAGPWTEKLSGENSPSVFVSTYAARQIARRRKRLLRRGRRLIDLKPKEVHELRIRAKNLRYATEFFHSLYSEERASKRWKRFAARMDALQEALGAYNDTVVRRSLLSEFAAAPQARENPAIAFAADQIVGTQHSLGHRLLKNAAKTLSKLKSAKAFWKVEQSEFETHSRRLQSRTAVQISGPMPHADAA